MRRPSRGVELANVLLAALAGLLMGAADPALVKSRQAEKKFQKGDLDGALRLYEEARAAKPGTAALDYDVGVVKFRKGDANEAAREFSGALSGGSETLRAHSYYNLGNCLYKADDYDGAAKAYQKALELAPGDADAKHNLELSLRMKQEQPPPQDQQKQDQQQKKSGDQKDPDQSKSQDQQKQDQQKQQQDQAEQQAGQENQRNRDQEQSQGAKQDEQKDQGEEKNPMALLDKNAMKPEDAKRLLDAIREEEARLMEAKEERNAQETGVARDW